jgi:hypothetical protein
MPARKRDDGDEDWGGVAVKQAPDLRTRLAELKAKAPVKRKKTRPFAMVYLNDAVAVTGEFHCPKMMVWIWLVHRTWKRRSRTVTVPNGELAKLGVTRETKRRALQQLVTIGRITIDQRPRKTPLVTVL